MPRDLTIDDTYDFLREEAVYTTSRLRASDIAKDLAKEAAKTIAQVETVRVGHYACWQAETEAQALVDDRNDALDDRVLAIGKTFDGTLDDDDPRWKRYLGTLTIKKIVAQGLETQVKTVASWPDSLASEEEKPLKAHAEPLRENLNTGEAALKTRSAAQGARRDFTARDKGDLVDAMNLERRGLHAELAHRATKLKLAKDWPDRFFRKAASAARAAVEPTPPAPDAPKPG